MVNILINVIVHEEGMALLDGNSAIIHDLNADFPPLLETNHQRLDYLQLFMNWVHGSDGRFQPIATEAELLARLKPDIAEGIGPFELCGFTEVPPTDATEAITHYSGTVLYGGGLFRAVMVLYPQGMVEMIDDDVLQADLPVREESLAGPMLISRI